MTSAAEDAPSSPNAIASALGLLGDEWSLLIVQQQFLGVRRFSALQASLGIGPTVLSARLATLVEAGVLDREDDGYQLTESGLDLWSLLLCIWAWEQRWVQGEALPTMRHTACGSVFHPVLACAGCAGRVGRDDVDVRLGPAGDLSRSVPTGRRRRRAGTGRSEGPGLFPETMAIMGNRWSSAVMGAAFLGAQRFRDFEAHLGAPPTIIAERLRQFVALGVLDEEYALSSKGKDFFPTVASLVAWGERWHPADDGPTLVATHTRCANAFVPQLRCSQCDAELNRSTVRIEGLQGQSALQDARTP